jgi:hypothetical protein
MALRRGAVLSKCIWPGCQEVWGEPEPGAGGYSHGLCLPHARLALASTFRRQQIREGNPDCYLRCSGYCHQPWCTFHPMCTADNPGPEQMAELKERLAVRRQAVAWGEGSAQPPERLTTND